MGIGGGRCDWEAAAELLLRGIIFTADFVIKFDYKAVVPYGGCPGRVDTRSKEHLLLSVLL